MTLSILERVFIKVEIELFTTCFYPFILSIFTNVNDTLITNKKCNQNEKKSIAIVDFYFL